jgi:hypothetical protein
MIVPAELNFSDTDCFFFLPRVATDPTQMAWTTRFAIVGTDGAQTAPANTKQPDGSKLNGQDIPWGVGHLLNAANPSASASAATNSVIPSSAPALSLSNAAPAASASVAPSANAASAAAAASPSTSQKSSASKILTTAGLGLGAVAVVMMAM